MNIIADVSKADPDSVAFVMRRVRHAVEGQYSMTILFREDQLAEIDALALPGAQIEKVPVGIGTAAADVALNVADSASKRYPVTLLFSFDGAVLTRVERNKATRSRVFAHPWGRTTKAIKNYLAAQAGQQAQAAPSSFISQSDAADVLVAALRDRGAISEATALSKTVLRHLLAARDERFAKQNPATNTPHYMSRLVEWAEGQKLISVIPLSNKNARVWLSEQGALPGVPSPVPEMASPRARPARDLYPRILEEHHMGPFCNVREDFYAALEQLACDNLPAGQLMAACIEAARAMNNSERQRGIPWGSVRDFLGRLLARRPVFVDASGGLVAPSFRTLSVPVASLVPDFRVVLDAELILFLLEKGAEITFMDMPALTGTLYPTREAHHEQKVHAAISLLISDGRVVPTEDRIALPAAAKLVVVPRQGAAA